MKLQIRFIPFIVLAILSLLFAMWAGLLRIGWALPSIPNLALAHGPLMICGFLGVLIPLERAVAIRKSSIFIVQSHNIPHWWGGLQLGYLVLHCE
jgi:hypothetical protein